MERLKEIDLKIAEYTTILNNLFEEQSKLLFDTKYQSIKDQCEKYIKNQTLLIIVSKKNAGEIYIGRLTSLSTENAYDIKFKGLVVDFTNFESGYKYNNIEHQNVNTFDIKWVNIYEYNKPHLFKTIEYYFKFIVSTLNELI